MARGGFSVFPTDFNVAGFALAQGVGTSHFISGFLIMGPCIAVESLCL